MKKTSIISLITMILCVPTHVLAGGAYIVDDAGIVEPGRVQIESWYSHSNKSDNAGTVDAAYQLLPHMEFSLLNTYSSLVSVPDDDMMSAQVKYQWHEGKDIASSAVMGINRSLTHSISGLYAYIPSTFAINDRATFNADLGWQYDMQENRHLFTWGSGTEVHMNASLSFVGEVFGNNTWQPGMQVGPRMNIWENMLLDVIYGRNIIGVSGNWLTTGVTATF